MNTQTSKIMKDKFNKPGIWLGLLLCALAFLPAGCSNDNELATDNPDGRVALQLTGGISIQTRAYDDTWDAGDHIGIYMYNAGKETIVEGAENIPYRLKKGETKAFEPAGTTIYFPVDGSNVDFHAWYPCKDVAGGEWTANLKKQSSQKALDLMTAGVKSNTGKNGKVYNKEQPKVALEFHHRLTKLVVNIDNGVGISPADLKGLTMEITQQVSTAIYEPDYDALGYEEELVTIPLSMNADGTFAEAILFPDDLARAYGTDRGRQLVFTLKNTGEKFYYYINDNKSFNAGEKNIYHITVNRTGLEVTAEIEDWTEGNGDGNPGSAE